MMWLWNISKDERDESEYCKLIVGNFSKFEKGNYSSKLEVAKKIYKIYPDKDFWNWMFLNCDIKVENLSFFLTKDGAEFLIKKNKLRNFSPSKKIDLITESGKIGEDKKITKKGSTIIGFIKNDKKI